MIELSSSILSLLAARACCGFFVQGVAYECFPTSTSTSTSTAWPSACAVAYHIDRGQSDLVRREPSRLQSGQRAGSLDVPREFSHIRVQVQASCGLNLSVILISTSTVQVQEDGE